jgi:uncharacterized protein
MANYRSLAILERFGDHLFARRLWVIGAFLLMTIALGFFAARLQLQAGFEKQLPLHHEYIEIFQKYRDAIGGTNRLVVVVKNKRGDIWNRAFFARLESVTKDLYFLPGVNRQSVRSLWTPTTRYVQITEDGLRAADVIDGAVSSETLTNEMLEQIRGNVITGGYIGTLVSNDNTSAMIFAELLDIDPKTGQSLDYLALGQKLEAQIRDKYESTDYSIHILGFPKAMSDIADGMKSVAWFFGLALVLTGLALFAFCRSASLTLVTVGCSLASLVWQLGLLKLMGYGLDPLAILVPFLVFAIGVSHGVQQVNFILREIDNGVSIDEAARRSFSGLLAPGVLALSTTVVSFITLLLIPIPMVQEMAVTATLGVGLKIISNLILLPLCISILSIKHGRSRRAQSRVDWFGDYLVALTKPTSSIIIVAVACILFFTAVWQSRDRHIGDLDAGVPELKAEARYNTDADLVANSFSFGLDVLAVVIESPRDGCIDFETMDYVDRLSNTLLRVEGVRAVNSAATLARMTAVGLNEGNPKWAAIPRDKSSLAQAVRAIPNRPDVLDQNCEMLAIQVFLSDHRAPTINRVISAVKKFREHEKMQGITVRLASGNAGVIAATNEVIAERELPMMLYVYAAIIVLVILTYRDWRATICCCIPLTVATFLGYWFMKELDIGLKVSTLPVMVLAVGIGVDYAFYIYNRLQIELLAGRTVHAGLETALRETGNATVFTALTLAIGVSTWVFSDLKFQSDMGLLLTFMFLINMIMAVTLLPALLLVLDRLKSPASKRVITRGA